MSNVLPITTPLKPAPARAELELLSETTQRYKGVKRRGGDAVWRASRYPTSTG